MDSMKRVVLSGLSWQSSSAASVTIIRLGITAVLGRHLEPSAFGIIAISGIYIAFAQLFTDIGVGPALVQKNSLSTTEIQGAFYLSIFVGAILSIIGWFTAPAFEQFFDTVGVAIVLRWLCLSFAITSFSTVSSALLQRRLRFKTLMILEIAKAIVIASVAIPVAIRGGGVWSIVYSTLAGTTFMSTALLCCFRHPVIPRIKLMEMRALLGHGSALTLSKLLTYIAQNSDYFIIGKFIGTTSLGLYERSYKLMLLPSSLLGTTLDKVLFPAMSKIQHDSERLRRGFFQALSLGFLIQVPICVILALLAPELTLLLLGPGWEQTILPLQILAISIPLRILTRLSDSLVRAKGAFYQSAVRKAIYATSIVLCSWIGHHWNIEGVAAGVLVGVAVNFFLMANLGNFYMKSDWRDHWKAFRRGLLIAVILTVIGFPLVEFLRHAELSTLIVTSLSSTILGAAFASLLHPRLIGLEPDNIKLLNSLVSRRKQSISRLQ